jgi:ABC-2 type transport system ATP-binding protein
MQDPIAIECRALVKCFGDHRAVDAIDLSVKRGTCYGLLGPNGAGKTTTVEMIEGLTAPTSGTIRVLGEAWQSGRERELRERIGVQLQETVLADKLTVEEVVTLFRSFYRAGRPVEELIGLMSLEPCRRQRYCELSGGQKQRVAVACALVGSPELLFLDEPTTGLDPRARQELWGVVRDFRSRGGTVVLTTHYMEEAKELCDELSVMDRGRIIATGTPRELIDRLGDVQFLEFELAGALDESTLRALSTVRSVARDGARCRIELDRSMHALSQVLAQLDTQGISPIGLSAHQATLDDVFLRLTGHRLDQNHAQQSDADPKPPDPERTGFEAPRTTSAHRDPRRGSESS